ncbi:MAG: hypothetical protein CAPSK01_001361 [Candidatus Accumulibacter vicinus]|uniref:Uncharacterized protein n=1 Tax=Candidatus Accumulibacter vicinus TaxID=2954382 RepID=A0A084Y375_9PROT|nr:MAG: hypothetical protein CAPSK01_001361 [Candidatus Accumulibacter vicinus]
MDENSQKLVREESRLIEAVPDSLPDGQRAFLWARRCRSLGLWGKAILDATGMAR